MPRIGAAKVEARNDIRTRSGLRIAMKGDGGRAIPLRKPNEPANWNKVLVQFKGRTRRYWVWPDDVTFANGADLGNFIAIPAQFDRYDQPPLPANKTSYDYHFGRNLKLIRESREISQATLGKRMGGMLEGDALAQSTIAYREQCAHSPNGSFTDAAAKALDVMPFVFYMPLEYCDVFPVVFKYLRKFSNSLCK